MVWSATNPLTREEVVWLFRSILGREPDEGAIRTFITQHPTFAAVRNDLLYSTEFYLMIKDRLSDFRATYRACDYPLQKLDSSMKRQTLCLVCIMKNEEEQIGRMIRSCLPIVDHIVIVDTGSTDNSVEAALGSAGTASIEVHRIEFLNFEQARNTALDFAHDKGDWILALDADEYVVPEDLAAFIHMISAENDVDGWRLPRFNFLNDETPATLYLYPDYQRRLFRNHRRMRFVGHVHELLEGPNRWGFAPLCEVAQGGSCGGPHIHHTGLLDQRKAREKFELYKSLGHLAG